ncbi:TonB-dependent receptor [Pedomonas mirosovicensis]|uniref:TonB-dependent receptor n=1 Tax=Pedomonas mirosovicensis TaxID=2908641 RepID=UPI0021684D92|nr:TonB-dependent receptor [Pedomonas mirosovicensis]MCH8686801.1 TonB-dependent receptor [Pedomonas mirosovicensis]
MKGKLYLSASVLMMGMGVQSAMAQDAAATAQTDGSAVEMDAIVVTGVRASLVGGLEVKKNSTQIVESIIAEDVGKLPDNNVVEALQRITGVQVTDRASGQVGRVFIRGLDDVTTTWNGRNIFTASGQNFALADIPANLVRRIDVFKTRNAEQIESGIAGQIDVFTRRPFDFDGFAVTGAVRGVYHEQADKINPNVSALISDRWETSAGEFGALLNVSYERTRFRDQSITAGAIVPFATADNPPAGWAPLERIQPTDGRAPDQQIWIPGLNSGLPTAPNSTLPINGEDVPYLLGRDAMFGADLTGKRERPAVNLALQYSPNSKSEYTFEFFYSGFRNQTFNNLHFTFVDWWGNPDRDVTLYPDSNLIKSRTVRDIYGFNSGDMTKQKTDSFVYALNGKWDITDNFQLTADLSYQTSKFTQNFLALRTERVADIVTVDFNAGGGLPSWEFGDNSLMTDPSQWTLAQFYDNGVQRKGEAVTLSVDGDYDFDSGLLTRLSFGFRHDVRSASEAQRDQNAGVLGRKLSEFDEGLYHTNNDFFDGKSNVPSSWVVPSGSYLWNHADEFRKLYQNVNPNLVLSDQLAFAKNFDLDEVTTSAYVQADMEHDVFGRPLFVQVGARAVRIETDMQFFNQLSAGDSDAASKKVTEFLPSVTLRYDITDNLRLRFNYGETIRRPNFVDLNPFILYTDDLTNIGYGTGSGGNPDLEPTRSKNFDLGLEWYFANDSAIYATLFRRKIDGLVVPLRQVRELVDPKYVATQFVVTQPVNASNGIMKGAELGMVYFPELPGLLNGLGVQGSMTLLDTKQNIPLTNEKGEIIGEASSDFFGVSDISYNVTLAYEHGPVGMRVSYVWRDDFLNNNEAAQFAGPIGIWRKAEQSLDAQFTYNVNDRMALTFDAVNLTNEIYQSYYYFDGAGSPETTNFGNSLPGRTFAIGFRYSLN